MSVRSKSPKIGLARVSRSGLDKKTDKTKRQATSKLLDFFSERFFLKMSVGIFFSANGLEITCLHVLFVFLSLCFLFLFLFLFLFFQKHNFTMSVSGGVQQQMGINSIISPIVKSYIAPEPPAKRPKHLFHMRAATGALSTNPATAPPPAKLFCSVRTITLESAAERARRA